jgi:hypothetical protein
MNPLVVVLAITCIVFVTWYITRTVYIERFTTNFDPDDQGMEQTIHGYAYQLGDTRPDAYTFFGFPDDIRSEFEHRLLPDIIPYDDPIKKS